MQTDSNPNSLIKTKLPWIISALALIFYSFTLHRWLTPDALMVVPRIAGWEWEPLSHLPLYFLLTLPIRWMPESWHLIATNLFSCLCASLTLGLLARSISLLPHDRTKDQRQAERSEYSFLSIRSSWIPILLGVTVCGLQTTFWRHAIVGTPEALDLLLFAYIIRCLLEGRINPRDSWLMRAFFVYGLAMTNNFAMVGLLPSFLTAVVWIRGMQLFQVRLILQLLLWGLLGMSFYFLLPAVTSLSGTSEASFWELVRNDFGFQKHALMGFERHILLLISLTSLLPVFFIGIRWPAPFGDISAAGNFITNLTMHIIHGVFLLICIYVAFDPPFSPRQLIKPAPYQLLPFYYLGALSIGYFAGYFLLVFSKRPARTWERPSLLRSALGSTLIAAIWIASFATPLGLFITNFDGVKSSANKWLHNYGIHAVNSLPPEGGIVLSDDLYRLYSTAAALAQRKEGGQYVLVHTPSLDKPGYHVYMARHHPQKWTARYLAERPLEDRLKPEEVMEAMKRLNETSKMFYLQPSFGYYFEDFFQQPNKLVCSLHLYAPGQIRPTPLTETQVQENSAFWDKLYEEELHDMAGEIRANADSPEPDPIKPLVGVMYSRALDYYGVELQKLEKIQEAGKYFYRALELHTNNVSAYINRDYNDRLQKGITEPAEPSEGAVTRIGLYGGNWNAILNGNGPLDEPITTFLLAKVLGRENNFRQTALNLERVVHFTPDNFEAQAGLAAMYTRAGFPDKGREHVAFVKSHFNMADRSLDDQFALLQAEAWSYAKEDNWAKAEALFTEAQTKYPKEAGPFGRLAELYLDDRQYAKAMEVLEKQMLAQPENKLIALPYSWLKIQNKNYSEAVAILTSYLAEHPNDVQALLNRALAYFLDEKNTPAKKDYETTLNLGANPPPQAYYGLAQIALREKDNETALSYFRQYLVTGPPNTPQSRYVREQVELLKKRL